MKKYSYHIITFGCQMNEHDSEIIAGMLTKEGYEETLSRDEADVIILNTCSVRENADNRFFGTLGQLKKRKETDTSLTVCVCGCMMQQQHIIDRIKEKYPWVDIIFGTHNIHTFPELLQNTRRTKERIADIWQGAEGIIEDLPAKRRYKHKAFVTIMYGCDNFCSYCIVPYTRGRQRSRKQEDILREVRQLVQDGVKEVTLLGQNVNSWQDGSMEFAHLIRVLDQVPGLQRIRFMTSHPKDLSPGLISAFAGCDKLCKHIHLPVQAGSNAVLERMNRNYSRETYLSLIAALRDKTPEITITTDIIVGFPGETEEDFVQTLDMVKQVQFDAAFTFLYSIRKGTPAEGYRPQVPEDMKQERFNRLVETVDGISATKNKACLGKTMSVLVDGISKSNAGTLTGRTEGFKLVHFPGSPDMAGNLIDIEITKAKTFSLQGKVLRS